MRPACLALLLPVLSLPCRAYSSAGTISSAPDMDLTINNVLPGQLMLGAAPRLTSVKYKVVLVQITSFGAGDQNLVWRLAQWHGEYEAQGLMILCIRSGAANLTGARQMCIDAGVRFPVYSTGRIKDNWNTTYSPQTVIFDHTGKCVFRGRSIDEAEKELLKAMRMISRPVFELVKFKKLRSIQRDFRRGVAPYKMLAALRKGIKSNDKTRAAESQLVMDKIIQHAASLLEDTKALKSQDPYECLRVLKRLQADFKGTPPADEAASLEAEYIKDARFQDRVRARVLLINLHDLEVKLRPVRASARGVITQTNKRNNARILNKMKPILAKVLTSYSNTPEVLEAQQMARRYGLL